MLRAKQGPGTAAAAGVALGHVPGSGLGLGRGADGEMGTGGQMGVACAYPLGFGVCVQLSFWGRSVGRAEGDCGTAGPASCARLRGPGWGHSPRAAEGLVWSLPAATWHPGMQPYPARVPTPLTIWPTASFVPGAHLASGCVCLHPRGNQPLIFLCTQSLPGTAVEESAPWPLEQTPVSATRRPFASPARLLPHPGHRLTVNISGLCLKD